MKCPGQDRRDVTAGLYKCPHCGKIIEMFSDEVKRRCPACKKEVIKKKLPACVQWCKSAKLCLGEEKWKMLINALNSEKK
ncbi:MAG: phosphohydrolase [Planctomycetota bacterium]